MSPASKKPEYTKGFTDAEILFEHLANQEKAARRAEWLKLKSNPSKDGKKGSDALPT